MGTYEDDEIGRRRLKLWGLAAACGLTSLLSAVEVSDRSTCELIETNSGQSGAVCASIDYFANLWTTGQYWIVVPAVLFGAAALLSAERVQLKLCSILCAIAAPLPIIAVHMASGVVVDELGGNDVMVGYGQWAGGLALGVLVAGGYQSAVLWGEQAEGDT